MAVHKLSIDDFDEADYELVAIHTALEDYHLAYFINRSLPVLLSKNNSEIPASTMEGEAWFSRFTYEDQENGAVWNLIQNKNEITGPKKNSQAGLFANESAINARVYFLPEFKKVDYFLKIENSAQSAHEVAAGLQSIEKISTVYPVTTGQIKSKYNLIF